MHRALWSPCPNKCRPPGGPKRQPEEVNRKKCPFTCTPLRARKYSPKKCAGHLIRRVCVFFFESLLKCEALGENFEYVTKCKNVPDVFFVSVFLYILTFSLAMTLRYFRTSRFFPSAVRSKVADFGVIITIAVTVLVDNYLKFDTPKLAVPLKFEVKFAFFSA